MKKNNLVIEKNSKGMSAAGAVTAALVAGGAVAAGAVGWAVYRITIHLYSAAVELMGWGTVNAALIGESLMVSPDISAKMKELLTPA